MANNLFISYDLYVPGQNYDAVSAAIKKLGNWAKVHKSFWYVRSNLSVSDACSRVWTAMDRNDSLFVVDATNNIAEWRNISDEVASFLSEQWFKVAA